jgi:hypothetical protein
MILWAVVLIAQNNCAFFDNGAKLPGGSEYYEIKKIPYSNNTERIAAFNSYPVEKQIDIYLFAMIHKAPADAAFGEYLKVNGESKIAKLADAIENINSPMAKGYLIGATWEIDRECNCVANNPKIMEILKRRESPPDPNDDEGDRGWKKSYSWTLFELQRKSTDKKDKTEIQNMPNPYSNSTTNRAQ